MPAPDFHAMAAREAEHLPPDWTPGIYRTCGTIGFELIGAVPIGYFSRGIRKGKPKFPPLREMLRVYVSREQLEKTKATWRQETGLCIRCGGDGQEIAMINSSGTTFRPCGICHGSGKGVAI